MQLHVHETRLCAHILFIALNFKRTSIPLPAPIWHANIASIKGWASLTLSGILVSLPHLDDQARPITLTPRQRCHGGRVCTLSVKRLATDRRVRPLRPGLRFPYSPANAREQPLPFTSDSMRAKQAKELKADTVLHRTNDTSASITHFVIPGAPPCRNGPLRKRAPPIEPDWGNT